MRAEVSAVRDTVFIVPAEVSTVWDAVFIMQVNVFTMREKACINNESW